MDQERRKRMKYFIKTKEGPMVKSLGLTDSDAKYIKIADALVAEMTDEEVKNLESQGFIVEPDERYFIPPPVVAPHLQSVDYLPNSELDPQNIGEMQQMKTTGVSTLADLGYFGADVHIGIADSGIDIDHPDVGGNCIGFKDFIDVDNTDPIDPGAHGCIAPTDLIYNSQFGLQNIESFFNSVEGTDISDDKSEIKDISSLNIKTISYDVDKQQTTVNKIMAVHKLFYKGEIYKVKTNVSELTLTPWHPLYIAKNKSKRKTIKKRADLLELGDSVLLSGLNDKDIVEENQKAIFKQRYICKYCGRESRRCQSLQCQECYKYNWHDDITVEYIDINEKVAFLCGLVFSDGNISKNKQRVSFFSNDLKLIEVFESLIYDIFKIICKRDIDKRNSKCIRSYFYNKDISEMFLDIGLIAGSKSRICDIPKKICISPKNIIMSFIAGVIEGDGNIGNGRIRISSGSLKFAQNLVELMKFMGIKASYNKVYSNGGFERKIVDVKPSYSINIQSSIDITSKLLIKNSMQYKTPKNRKYSKIISIEKIQYCGYMYDLTIENSPVYAANGMIVSNTACASIMLGKGHYTEKFHGVAPAAKFSMARVMDAEGYGSSSTILEGVDWLVDQGVEIINLSLGSMLTRYNYFSEAVDTVVSQGVSVFVAAGNDGPQQITSPANAVNAVTCAACNKDGQYSSFSSLGPAKGPDSLSIDKPDIMAWGEYVALAKSHGTTMGHDINEHYIYASGTSFATPFMAGCAAILKSVKKDLTPAQIKDLLLSTAYDNGSYDKYHEGFGNVRILEAVNKLLSGELDPYVPTTPVKTGSGCLSVFA